MKRTLLSLLFVFASFAIIDTAKAQVRVGININIGSQPDWGPVGYDYAEYYYLPDIEAYYYVPRHQFVYMSNGRWIFSANLPPRYASYDLYRGYKVVVNTPYAYRHYRDHRVRYAGYRNHYDRQVVRNDNGRHKGWDKRNNKWDRRDRGHGRNNRQ
jgi:hypothetical protein